MTELPQSGLEPEFGRQTNLEVPSTAILFRGPSVPFVFLRLCLYLALAAGMSYGLHLLTAFLLPIGQHSLLHNRLLREESIELLSVLSAALAMCRIERRSF